MIYNVRIKTTDEGMTDVTERESDNLSTALSFAIMKHSDCDGICNAALIGDLINTIWFEEELSEQEYNLILADLNRARRRKA